MEAIVYSVTALPVIMYPRASGMNSILSAASRAIPVLTAECRELEQRVEVHYLYAGYFIYFLCRNLFEEPFGFAYCVWVAVADRVA